MVIPGQNFQPLVSPGFCDPRGEGEIGVTIAGLSHKVSLRLLAQIPCATRLTADGNKGGQIPHPVEFVIYNGANPGVQDERVLIITGLQLIGRPTVGGIGALNRTDECGVMHLLG